jgi:hypothetical protein
VAACIVVAEIMTAVQHEPDGIHARDVVAPEIEEGLLLLRVGRQAEIVVREVIPVDGVVAIARDTVPRCRAADSRAVAARAVGIVE